MLRKEKGKFRKLCHTFYGKLSIRSKLMVSCLPFVILGYVVIFCGITALMFSHMKQIVYQQTEQNIVEKTNLINTTLSGYEQSTTKFLYYTPEVQEYLNIQQSTLGEDAAREWKDMISYQISALITNNQASVFNVCLYNKFGEVFLNNAIYSNTIAQMDTYRQSLEAEADLKHGKPIISSNPFRSNVITFARNVYVPELERSNEKIGFLMMDINKSQIRNILRNTGEAISIVLLDVNGNILVNGSSMDDQQYLENFQNPSPGYLITVHNVQYGNCSLVSMVNEKLLFHEAYSLFFKEMVSVFVAIMIIVAAIFGAGTSISKQLQSFMRKLRQTTEIDQNAYVVVDTQDEFRKLADVYNEMLARIEKLIQQVYKQEILAKDSQIESLQAQINPHFLYNTLDCINSLADLGKMQEVKKTVISLGNIMRMSIKGDAFLKIEEELEYVNQYLYIQKMRFQEKILYLVEIPETLYQYYIPKLTIQPLLENAMIHGVSGMQGTGMIVVLGGEEEDGIYITVKDNGVGIPETVIRQLDQIQDVLDQKKHIGIFNIQQRIHLLYGSTYGLSVERLQPSGTSVTVRLPKIREV